MIDEDDNEEWAADVIAERTQAYEALLSTADETTHEELRAEALLMLKEVRASISPARSKGLQSDNVRKLRND